MGLIGLQFKNVKYAGDQAVYCQKVEKAQSNFVTNEYFAIKIDFFW